jgi:hypothetical protein
MGMDGAAGRRRWLGRQARSAGARSFRLAGAALVATCMAVCMVPMGCGASDGYAEAPRQRTSSSLPPVTIRALQACGERHGGRLSRHAYEIGFEVELKGDRVREVTPQGPRLDDAGLERCLMDALRTMADAGFSRESELISYGGLLPRQGVLANVSVLDQLIRLAPLVVTTASGTTIVVAIMVLVVVAAVSMPRDRPTEEECEEEWKHAKAECERWLSTPNPPKGVVGWGLTMKECIEGYVSEACGGKKRKRGPQGPRPGRRY